MSTPNPLQPEDQARVECVLGYLNFSSGAEDPSMLGALNQLYARVDDPAGDVPPHESIHQLLLESLQAAELDNGAFADASQARRVLKLSFQHVLPHYLIHHRDLLFHRSPESLFNALFLGRVFETVLGLAPDDNAADDWARQAVALLNDSGYEFTEIELGKEWFLLGPRESVARVALSDKVESGATSLPKIFIGGQCIGGWVWWGHLAILGEHGVIQANGDCLVGIGMEC